MAACSGHGSNPKTEPASAATGGRGAPSLLSATNAAEWKKQLPVGATLVASASGDLDADGDDDTLVVFAPSPTQDNAARTLLVLVRDSGGVLRPTIKNPKAILCRGCGGMMGDPLQSIGIGRGGFTLRFEGGWRELWSTEFRFEHTKAGGWQLAAIEERSFDRIGGSGAPRRRSRTDFGEVMLDAFEAEDVPAGALQ